MPETGDDSIIASRRSSGSGLVGYRDYVSLTCGNNRSQVNLIF